MTKFTLKILQDKNTDNQPHKNEVAIGGGFFLKPDRVGSGYVLRGVTPEHTIQIKDKIKQPVSLGGFDARYTGKGSWWIAGKHAGGLLKYLQTQSGGSPKKKSLDNISVMLKIQQSVNMKELTTLTDKEIDYLVKRLKIKDQPDNIDQKTKAVLDTLAQKLCNCIEKDIRTKENLSKVAVCVQSIFKNRGLKVSKFSCKKRPVLMPKKGEKIVLKRQPGVNVIKMN